MSEPKDYAEFIQRCKADPVFFIESCLFIVDKDSKKVPFLLNAVQKTYIKNRTNRDIILKSRKMGFSTLLLALALHTCVFNENAKAVVVSHEGESTKRMFKRLKYMIQTSALPIKIGEDSSSSITFPNANSSCWIGTAGAKSFGRGDDISFLHFSEPAQYQNWDIVTGAMEALVNNAFVVLETTAQGSGNPYHDLWVRSANGTTSYKTHFYPWFMDPTYTVESGPLELSADETKLLGLTWGQVAWRRSKLREMPDPKLFPQEYPSNPNEAFLASGRMVFDWEDIKAQEDVIKQPDGTYIAPKWKGVLRDAGQEYKVDPVADGPLSIWRTADPRCSYLLVFDGGDGVGKDYSVADIFDQRTWEQVAQWRGNMTDTGKFGEICYGLGHMYNWAIVSGENKYPGNAVWQKLKDLQYPNIWQHSEEGTAPKPGFVTSEKLKAILIGEYREALRDRDIRINSPASIAELKTFRVTDEGKMEAQSGCHDDTVIVGAGAVYTLKRIALAPDLKRKNSRDHFTRRVRPMVGYQNGPRAGIV